MAKLDPAIEAAGKKLLATPRPKAATGTPGGFLMSIVRGMVLPSIGPIISELLKSANAKTKKYLIQARDILVNADLGDA